MKPPVYKVGTMLDIARIPPEALPRFIAELPEMVGMLREVDKFHKGMAAQAPDEEVAKELLKTSEAHLISGLEWVDDGKDDFKITVVAQDEDGNQTVSMHADSSTRDIAAYHKGEDRTYDILLAGRLQRAGLTITDKEFEVMMPEGDLILPAERLHEIRDMTPEDVNELCLSANRTLKIRGQENEVPSTWRAVARVISREDDA